jgi:hypothetical protein
LIGETVETVKFSLFNHGSKKLVVPYGQLIGHLIVLGKVIYPIARNVDDPEPDDDADTEGCCNELSNKFEKIEISIDKKAPRRALHF